MSQEKYQQHGGDSGLPGARTLRAGEEADPTATAQLSDPVVDQAGAEVDDTGKVSISLENAVGDAQEGPLKNFKFQNAVGDADNNISRIDKDNDFDESLNLTNRDDINTNFADITLVGLGSNANNDSNILYNSMNNDSNFLYDSLTEQTTFDNKLSDSKETNSYSYTASTNIHNDTTESTVNSTINFDNNFDLIQKRGRSQPQTTKERRFGKKQRKEQEKYKRPEDPKLAKIDDVYMQKTTYSDCVKNKKTVMLEVRCSDLEIALDQEDYNRIDRELTVKYGQLKLAKLAELENSNDESSSDEEIDANNMEDKFFYGAIGGIANGACWFACDNETTAEFVKEHVPKIEIPELMYSYTVFTTLTKPFRYMQAKIPIRHWDCRATTEGLFRAFNKCLHKRIRNDNGKKKLPHFKICFGCEDKNIDLDEKDPRYFWVQFEVDERLMPELISLKGRLRLGTCPIQLLGGGMVKCAKDKIAKDLELEVEVVKNSSG